MPRRIDRVAQSHTGQHAVLLENREKTFTRLRQGADKTLQLPPGCLIELTAWIKPSLSPGGRAGLQFYCMDDAGKILAQPRTDISADPGDWQRLRLIAHVPPQTRYSMVYLHIDSAPGSALFDDVDLRILRAARPVEPGPRFGLLTDLPESDPGRQNLARLLGRDLVLLQPDTLAAQLASCEAAAILLRSAALSPDALASLTTFAHGGGRVFMDLRCFAAAHNLPTRKISLPSASTVQQRMQLGLTVTQPSPITAGFQPNQIIPYIAPNNTLEVLSTKDPRLDVLATAADHPALVQLRTGKGFIVSADLLSLREPYVTHIDAYYKYLFLANTLARPDRLILAEYHPRKLSYTDFVAAMRQLANDHPALQFAEEGPAHGDYKLYSLTIGRPGTPLYFLYAAAHGSEWEPAYGLLTFARRLAEGKLASEIDLSKVRVKILPILNPSGYDLRQRQNANGVDLNRQGDTNWPAYVGRDSTGDGVYGPRDYDWKGTAPFTEPEAQTYRRIVSDPALHCVLDLHGNTSATNNKLAILPIAAHDENTWRSADFQSLVNQRLRSRYLLHQADEPAASPYLLDRIQLGNNRPVLLNTSARNRFGLLVEITCGYSDSYGTVLQTEVTCELARALFQAYPPTLNQ